MGSSKLHFNPFPECIQCTTPPLTYSNVLILILTDSVKCFQKVTTLVGSTVLAKLVKQRGHLEPGQMLRSTLVLNIGKLNENRKPALCQLFTRGCLFGRLSMTTCKCKTSFDGELLLALSKLATHPPFMGQCKHAITISSLSLSASNLPIQSTRDKSSSMGLSWSIVPRRRDFQLVDSENS